MDENTHFYTINTLWVLFSTLLVLLMVIPGMALFYAGMVRRKNTLSVIVQVSLAFMIGLFLWFLYGYSLVFTEFSSVIGGLKRLSLHGFYDITTETFSLSGDIPELVFAMFQAMFAGLSCALIVGALVERVRLSFLIGLIILWFTFSYLPIAHMVWFSGTNTNAENEVLASTPGWLFARGALDFAGGTVVHINAGMAAVVAAFMIGKRRDFGKAHLKPHNLVMTFIGASFLWLGWFGFNAGSALGINFQMIIAFFNTLIAGIIGIFTWAIAEQIKYKKVSLLGLCSGLISGLVAITPAAAFVGFFGTICVTILTTLSCFLLIESIKSHLKIDDSLDVFGIHGIGGIVGALATGIFCATWFGGTQFGGAELLTLKDVLWQLWIQFEGVIITMIWSGTVTYCSVKLLLMCMKDARVSYEEEQTGLDISIHAESIYPS